MISLPRQTTERTTESLAAILPRLLASYGIESVFDASASNDHGDAVDIELDYEYATEEDLLACA